jgi:hypothetical protein
MKICSAILCYMCPGGQTEVSYLADTFLKHLAVNTRKNLWFLNCPSFSPGTYDWLIPVVAHFRAMFQFCPQHLCPCVIFSTIILLIAVIPPIQGFCHGYTHPPSHITDTMIKHLLLEKFGEWFPGISKLRKYRYSFLRGKQYSTCDL